MNSPQAYKKSSFGPAFFFLKRRQRKALANYYAFCRMADDVADEPQTDPHQALKNLEHEVTYIYLGAPKTQWGQALLQDIRRFHIPQDRFTLLLEGMRADLQGKSYVPSDDKEPFKEVDWYIYRVAVIVGKATLDILEQTGPKADELAQTLGTAVQLTNIVRDVYEDAHLGRVYVPCKLTAAEILQVQQTAGVAENSAQKHIAQENLPATPQTVLRDCLEVCCRRAHACYRHAFQLMDEFWPVTMLPCRIMGYVYQKNLAKIEETGLRFTQPVKLTKLEKLQAVGYAIFKTLF